jgi:hypothetical protein
MTSFCRQVTFDGPVPIDHPATDVSNPGFWSRFEVDGCGQVHGRPALQHRPLQIPDAHWPLNEQICPELFSGTHEPELQ